MRWSRAASTLLLALGALGGAGCGRHAAPAAFDCSGCSVVLISIDTLRADHVGVYGYGRETTPRIDSWAKGAVRFGAAYSASYHTAESHMTVFTSLFPSVHGVSNTGDASQATTLAEGIRTLPEQLHAAGFETAGFHAGGNVSRPYGFGRGFDLYRQSGGDVAPAIEWLEQRSTTPDSRFFLFFHTYRPHDPYVPDPPYNRLWEADYEGKVFGSPEEFYGELSSTDFAQRRRLFWSRVDVTKPEDMRKLVALYDGEIRETDNEIGALLDRVGRMPQRVLTVLFSDHGEEFQEHGRFLHDQVYQESLRVPFLVRFPSGTGGGLVIGEPVSLVDLAPTLLDALGVETFASAQGRSLLPELRDPQAAPPRRAFLAEKVLSIDPASGEPGLLKQGMIVDNLKLVALPDGRKLLFDLAHDRGELDDLSSRRAGETASMAQALLRWNAANSRLRRSLVASGVGVPQPLDRETIENLRALGYLQ